MNMKSNLQSLLKKQKEIQKKLDLIEEEICHNAEYISSFFEDYLKYPQLKEIIKKITYLKEMPYEHESDSRQMSGFCYTLKNQYYLKKIYNSWAGTEYYICDNYDVYDEDKYEINCNWFYEDLKRDKRDNLSKEALTELLKLSEFQIIGYLLMSRDEY